MSGLGTRLDWTFSIYVLRVSSHENSIEFSQSLKKSLTLLIGAWCLRCTGSIFVPARGWWLSRGGVGRAGFWRRLAFWLCSAAWF